MKNLSQSRQVQTMRQIYFHPYSYKRNYKIDLIYRNGLIMICWLVVALSKKK